MNEQSIIQGNDLAGTDRGQAPIDRGIDAIIYKTNSPISESEISASRVAAIEIVIVRPISNVAWDTS